MLRDQIVVVRRRLSSSPLRAQAPASAGAPFTLVLAMNVNLAWTHPAVAGRALRQLLAPSGRVLLGFEPPTLSGCAVLRAKLARAAYAAGFAVHAAYQPDHRTSGAFAVEWRAKMGTA